MSGIISWNRIYVLLHVYNLNFVNNIDPAENFMEQYKGFRIRLNSGLPSAQKSFIGVTSAVWCAVLCAQTSTCITTNYHEESSTCELLNYDAYSENVNKEIAYGWTVLSQDIEELFLAKGTKILFRVQKEVEVSVEQAWTTTGFSPSPAPWCRFMTSETTACTQVYRNAAIDNWTKENFKEIIFQLYSANIKVKEMTFSALGTNHTSWFSQSKLLKSPWSTLTATKPSYMWNFAISGDGFAKNRKFFICYYYNTCAGDEIFFVVIEADFACSYEHHSKYPQFIYAPGDKSSVLNSERAEADVLIIVGRK